ncbi:hypothetical protein H4F99_12050 [Lysobacter sp. SG-8]|uniref:DUF2884 family protein n=1 Tax=Marilutibacter penaei TaxID=2759900 RepID=A0A7W3U5U5_9GAMM|nr:hypothetical protein [Lysobacter penaei]MBB1089210.1 hypothetical protein [Lysobacter penaei]
MKHAHRIVLALLCCLPLMAACSRDANPAHSAAEGTRQASMQLREKMAEVRDKVREEMATEDMGLDSDDPNAPKARITPAGDLYIGDTAVAIDEAQRALLLEYRQRIAGVAAAGAEIGMHSASVATDAVGTAIAAIFSGENGDDIGKRIEAEIEPKIRAAVGRLCSQLPPLLETQKALVEQLPEFAPYADMDGHDIDDCMDEAVAEAPTASPTNEAAEAEAAPAQ